MKTLSLNEMSKKEGGCGALAAGAAVYYSSMGLVMVSLGPVGWGAALISGGAALAITLYCSE